MQIQKRIMSQINDPFLRLIAKKDVLSWAFLMYDKRMKLFMSVLSRTDAQNVSYFCHMLGVMYFR
jgi:hypothetical protein